MWHQITNSQIYEFFDEIYLFILCFLLNFCIENLEGAQMDLKVHIVRKIMTQNFVKKHSWGKKLVVWCHEQDLRIMLFYFQIAESNYVEMSLWVNGCNVTALLALLSLTIVAVTIFSIWKLKVNKKSDNWRKLDENEDTKKCFESEIIWTINGLLPIFVWNFLLKKACRKMEPKSIDQGVKS